jgi:hypothetical protein
MAPTLQAAGFKAEFGVDRHFFRSRRGRGDEAAVARDLAYQLDRFDQLSPKLQENRRRRRSRSDTSHRRRTRRGVERDTAMEAGADLVPRVARAAPALLAERTRTDRSRRSASINAGCFIVVGAAHLWVRTACRLLASASGHTTVGLLPPNSGGEGGAPAGGQPGSPVNATRSSARNQAEYPVPWHTA